MCYWKACPAALRIYVTTMPPPLGTVSGNVTAHDGTTPVSATVTIANNDLIFGRRVVVNTSGVGATFSFLFCLPQLRFDFPALGDVD